MLFNKEIEGLNDVGFEGPLDERRIFNEVFFGNDSDISSKKCLVTGVINFENDHCKKTNVSCSNSENSASTSQEGCLSEEFTLLTRNEAEMNVKRMKFSVSKPYLKKDLSFATPLEGDVSHSTYRPVTCRLVESSSHGVTSSCYLLKRQMVDRDASKSRVSRVDGSGPKEVVASKAIASPVSQESYATKQLVAFPSVTDTNKPCSLQLAKKRWKESCFLELDIARMKMPRDSTTDPRPLLRYHINRLLRAAGWVIGRRKRAKYSNVSGEYVYRSPEGRPIREFRRAWNLCGQSLFADDANIVVEDGDCKQWNDLRQFCTDLSNTLAEIKEQFDNLETTAALAHWWYLLDPFANVVFIDKTMGCLKAGNRVIAKRSLVVNSFAKCDGVLALKNVDSIGMDSALTVFEEGYGQVKALKGVSSHPSEGMYIHSVDTVNLTTSRNKSSSLDPCLLPVCGSDSTCDQTCTCLFEVPITWENENVFLRRSETLSYHHDSDTSSLNLDNDGSENNADKTLKVIKDDHSNCTNDSFTESHDSERTNVQLNACGNASQLWIPSLVEDSHLVDTEGGHCYETPIYLVDDAFFAADAMLKRKSYKKSKKIYEVELTTLYRSKELGLSTSNKAGLQDIGGSSIQLESSGAQECSVSNHRSNKNCKKLSLRSSQHRNHKKQSRCKKFLHNSCSSKKLLQVTNDSKNPKEFNFENTDKSPLNVNHESLDSQTWQCGIRSNKPETQDDGQKKLMTCLLKDDDLLISAIIKNKNFRSPTKRSSGERVSRKSKAQRKRRSQKGSCRLLPRSLNKGGKPCVEGKWSFFGTRTVLSWLINSGVVSLNEVILYQNPKDDAVVKDGLVTWDGILCRCCDKVLSVSEFKIHAGFRLNRPCLNLFLESGKPFTLCQLEAWSAEYKARRSATRTVQVEDMDQNDDSCGVCGDGGELICCDNCPSTFHQACMYAQELPEGSWYCPHCTCRICGDLVTDEDSSQSPGALKCLQCEHKYHAACHEERFLQSGVASDSWFCGDGCQEVYSGLQSRIGLMNLMSDGFSWTLLRCIHGDQKVHSAQRFVALKAECNLKLAVALTIMEECFLPMVDPRTGIDMIPHVLYNWGSEFARLNYHGFQTVVLEKDDVLMSVASIRIHGVQVAEMPLIATCSKYRRQGMCRRLMKAIEELLKSFKVEKLVISAIPSLVETWTNGFGFTPLEDNEKKSLRTINLMVFPGTIWLKKPLYKHRVSSPQTGSDDPTETGACSEGGPTIASDGNTPIKEVDAETERLKNTQICEDQDTCFDKQLTKPSCEEPASTTLERSQLDIVCHLESLQVYDDRKIPQLQKVNEDAASMFETDKHEIACNLESIQVYDDRKLTLSQHSRETNVLHGK